jgi:hypothetical protein
MCNLKRGARYKVKLFNGEPWYEVLYNMDGKWERVGDGSLYKPGDVTDIGPELGPLVDHKWLYNPFHGVKA